MIYPATYENKIGFDQVRNQVTALCTTPPGRSIASDKIVFMTDYAAVKNEIDTTAEMLSLLNGENPFGLGALTEPTIIAARLKMLGSHLSADEMSALGKSLATVRELSDYFAAYRNDEGVSSVPSLDALAVKLVVFSQILSSINRCIDRHGEIKDSASPELQTIRRQLASTNASLGNIMRRVMSQAIEAGTLESDTTPVMRDGRLVLPVSPMNKRKINGIVHDESASGKTFFIEPAELVEANNRIRELQIEENREIIRILKTLTDEIRPHSDGITASIMQAALFDFYRAKAVYAHNIEGVKPHLSDTPELEWYHAVHPLLMQSLAKHGREVVPLDITLTQNGRILLISGPNAGGKSVCLKTVGLIQYMLQCGLLPPVYENSHMGMFQNIFIDIGDDQSLEDDLSTYSSHLRNMKCFLQKGNASTLILIDEFGGGTEPLIGGAIAQSILEEFNNRQMWGVITTHYQNLKNFAEDTPGLLNGSMLYDRHLMQPTFRLSIGTAGSSFAIEIAQKTGLPLPIINKAKELVGEDYVNMDRYLLDIARDKRYWENKRQQIKQREKKIENVLAQYESDAETLRQKRKEIIEEARREAKEILDKSNSTIERTIREIRTVQAEKEKTKALRQNLDKEKEILTRSTPTTGGDASKLLHKAPKPKHTKPQPRQETPTAIAEGDHVKLEGQSTVGTVIKIEGKNAVVTFGMVRTTVQLSRLTRTMSKPQAPASGSSFVSRSTTDAVRDRQLKFKQEIDLRGMRVDEALQAVTYFIDDAIQFAAGRVRILHGTGTGALRQSIRELLNGVQGVKSYRDEDVRFGGAGITVVELD